MNTKAMETDDLYGEFDLPAVKMRIAEQSELNRRKDLEHFRKMIKQKEELEKQKEQLHSFVCDWQ